MQVVVHVDGGARGNPGPAAAAAVVSAPDGRVLDEAAQRIGTATNNVAEYRGLLLGLERAAALGATEVDVINDSELIAHQVDGSYKVKNADLKPLHAAALAALERFEPLVDPAGAARGERGGGRAREPRAGRGGGGGRAGAPGVRRHRLRVLPADRRPARAPAAADARRPRRAAVHRRPPGLRALVQADPARAGRGARRARGGPAAGRRAAPAAHRRGRAAAARPARGARDDEPGGVPGVPRPARTRVRLPVAPVPRDRVAVGRARHLAGRRAAAGRVALRGVQRRAGAAGGSRRARRGARRALPRPPRRAAGRLARGRRAADGPRRGDRRAGATTTP